MVWDQKESRKVPKYQDLVRLAQVAAERAAGYVRGVERPANPASWTRKAVNDFVTHVDREAERLVSETLLAGEPGSVVMGEELSPTRQAAGLLWVVDPLDGTTNYLHGYPQYAVSVGAVIDGVLAAGAVADVVRQVTYTGTRGGGAWCGGTRLSVSASTTPAAALIGTGFPFRTPDLLPRYLRQFAAVSGATSGIRRAGAAALDLIDVAAGRLDAFWELDLAAWDVAAGTLIVREAGGVVTDTSGSDDVVRQGPIVAGNPSMHQWLLDVVNRESPRS
jgi:myo-inositol-1(or 4)-monophosphatase